MLDAAAAVAPVAPQDCSSRVGRTAIVRILPGALEGPSPQAVTGESRRECCGACLASLQFQLPVPKGQQCRDEHEARAGGHTLMCWVRARAARCGAREAALQAAVLPAAHRCRRRRTPPSRAPAERSMRRSPKQGCRLCRMRMWPWQPAWHPVEHHDAHCNPLLLTPMSRLSQKAAQEPFPRMPAPVQGHERSMEAAESPNLSY